MTANQDFNSNNLSHQEMINGNSQRAQSTSKSFETYLTQDQLKLLQKFMPPGYSFISSKTIRQIPKRITSSVFNQEDSKTSNIQIEKPKRDAYYKAEQKIKEPVEFLKRCEFILSSLKKHKFGFPFLEPVDPEVLGIPDYFQIIKDPMDFSKVEKRLRSGYYKTTVDFEDDIRKIWDNATTYNKPNTEIYHMTIEISHFFEKLISDEETVYATPSLVKLPSTKVAAKKTTDYEVTDTAYKPSKANYGSRPSLEKPLTYQEKKTLSEMIRQLPSDSLWEVWKIVAPDSQNQGEELEFDIDTLSAKTSRKLEKFVKEKLQNMGKKTKPKTVNHFKEAIQPFNGDVTNSAQVTNVVPSSGLGQPRETLQTSVPKENGNVNKAETSNSSFLSNLSDSD